MACEDFSDVVKEFRGGTDMGHPDEKPMVLDSIKGLHAVHGGRVQRWGPWCSCVIPDCVYDGNRLFYVSSMAKTKLGEC